MSAPPGPSSGTLYGVGLIALKLKVPSASVNRKPQRFRGSAVSSCTAYLPDVAVNQKSTFAPGICFPESASTTVPEIAAGIAGLLGSLSLPSQPPPHGSVLSRHGRSPLRVKVLQG